MLVQSGINPSRKRQPSTMYWSQELPCDAAGAPLGRPGHLLAGVQAETVPWEAIRAVWVVRKFRFPFGQKPGPN